MDRQPDAGSLNPVGDGLDQIDLSDSGFLFTDLAIGNGTSGAEIVAGTSTLVLTSIDASVIDEADFVFV